MDKLIGSTNKNIHQEISMFGMRAQDSGPATHFRSDRLCRVNGMLYFITRENTHEGPFQSRDEALREIQAYIERVQVLQLSQ